MNKKMPKKYEKVRDEKMWKILISIYYRKDMKEIFLCRKISVNLDKQMWEFDLKGF